MASRKDSYNEQLFDRMVVLALIRAKHQEGIAKELQWRLISALKAVIDQASASIFPAGEFPNKKTKELNEYIAKLNKAITEVSVASFAFLEKQQVKDGLTQIAGLKRSLKKIFDFPVHLTDVDLVRLKTAILSRPFDSFPLKEWQKRWNLLAREKMTLAVNQAYFNGEGVEGAVRRMSIGPSSALNISKNGMSAISRTGLAHASNQAQDLFFEENKIATKYRYTAIIDGRTTFLCAGRDGRVYKMGERPMIPAHMQCRSEYIPVMDGEQILGTRSAVTSTAQRKKFRELWKNNAKKAYGKGWRKLSKKRQGELIQTQRNRFLKQNFSRVSANVRFADWLKRQSPAFQRDYLGKVRYNLFSKGQLSIDKILAFGQKLPRRWSNY